MQGKWQKLRGLWARFLDLVGSFRLTSVFLLTMLISVLSFAISLVSSNRIAQQLVRRDYSEYNETIFRQAESELDRNIQDLTNLCYTFMSNNTLVTYLSNTSFDGRTVLTELLQAEMNRMIAIESDIKGIFLYEMDGTLVSSLSNNKNVAASIFSQADRLMFQWEPEVHTSQFFEVVIPVFDVENARIAEQVGYCNLLMDMGFLEKSLSQILPNDDYFCLILDRDGRTLLNKGRTVESETVEQTQHAQEVMNPEEQVLYEAVIDRTQWRIVFGVPQKELYSNISLLQRNFYTTFLTLGAILALLFVVVYAGVLRPIHTQIRFMNYYAKNRKSRMEVRGHNEMGELAKNLNAMLDDIERLTDENVQARQRVLEAEYQKKQSELLAYRNQVNPHFLYNTFECIRGMALYYNVEDIAAITESLSSLFSYSLQGKGYAEIREVRQHVLDYQAIIQYRFNSRFSIFIDISEDAEPVLFPKMVIQPLVENAIFHGLEPQEKDGSVYVSVQRDGDRLKVQVRDNGIGMSEHELAELQEGLQDYDRTSTLPSRRHGIGMLNVYRRLRLFYGSDMQFVVESEKGKGTGIVIDVPCEIQFVEEKDVPGFFD